MSDNSGLWPALPTSSLRRRSIISTDWCRSPGSTRWIAVRACWGNIVYDVSLAGCGLPPSNRRVTFDVHYDCSTATCCSRRAPQPGLPLGTTTVAEFYASSSLRQRARHTRTGSTIATRSPIQCARRRPCASSMGPLPLGPSGRIQRNSRRSSVGRPLPRIRPESVYVGRFDLSATRYRAESVPPPRTDHIHAARMCESYVAVGLSFGSPIRRSRRLRLHRAQPDGLEVARGAESARWFRSRTHRAALEGLRCSEDPGQTVLDFADAVYLAAVETAGWPPDLVGERLSGWTPAAPDVRLSGRGGANAGACDAPVATSATMSIPLRRRLIRGRRGSRVDALMATGA